MATTIQIDPVFRAMIPPLQPEERAQLEANLLADGCRDPLVIWNGILVDGHNRYDICTTFELPYQTVSLSLADRAAAEDWIDANQLGRRNLAPDQASLLRGRRYNRTKKTHGGDRRSESVSSGQNVHLKELSSERLAQQHGVDERTIRRDGQFAAAVETLKPSIPDIEQRVMRGDVPSREAVVAAAKTPEAAKGILDTAVHVSHNSGNNEWYTPPAIVEAARVAMDGIDVDPASCEVANKTVNASVFFSAADDGLSQEWHGNVFLNPPYATPLVGQFAEAVSAKYDLGEIAQACVLVNNATETVWFQRVLQSASAVCFLKSRVRFLDPSGAASGAPLQGQAVLYLGAHPDRFAQSFEVFGCVLVPVQ